MKNTSIEWCDHTFNPWVGCTKISPGCAHCYAEKLESRWGKDLWGKGKERQRTGKCYWHQAELWDKEASRKPPGSPRPRVFCGSLCDVFDPDVPLEWAEDLEVLISRTRHLDWLLLTKRPEHAPEWLTDLRFVWENVWVGVSVENQEQADARIPILASLSAPVRFLSVEPMLEPIKLHHLDKIDWVIVGGESGPNCRPMNGWWATHVQAQCRFHGIAFFMKQMGGYPNKKSDIAQIPIDLQVRQIPVALVR